MKIIRRSLPWQALITTGLLAISALAAKAAVTSTPTSSVKGRAPVAAPSITGTLQVGQTLAGASGFSDADGDSESGTTYSWSGGGAIGSARTLVVPPAAGSNTITLTVTPRTDATVTDPAVGATSQNAVSIPASLGAFLTPNATLRTWALANTYCTGLGGGARLPTVTELRTLYLTATSATALSQNNTEMCATHGWPLSGKCGGLSSLYWSSTQSAAGRHVSVGLDTGKAFDVEDSVAFSVACVR